MASYIYKPTMASVVKTNVSQLIENMCNVENQVKAVISKQMGLTHLKNLPIVLLIIIHF